jgi:hypothetical protein
MSTYVCLGKLVVKGPLGRSRHRWEDNIKIDHNEIEWEGVSGQGPVAGSCEHSNNISGYIKC